MPSLFDFTTLSLRFIICARSSSRPFTFTPWSAKWCPACSKFSEDCSSALEGMQPTLVQVPPSAGLPSAPFHSSMHAVLSPSWAARIAAIYPPGPPPITTTSKEPISDLQDQASGIFQGVLYRHEEQHRLAAVDDAVVVGEREVVHRPDNNLAVLDHGAVLGRVHAEDRRLRRVDDRRREHRAEHAAVGDREGAAGELLQGELAVLRALAEVADL